VKDDAGLYFSLALADAGKVNAGIEILDTPDLRRPYDRNDFWVNASQMCEKFM
jgi:hypothetical protein